MALQLEDLIRHPLIRPALLPPWFCYLAASQVRNAAFDYGLRQARRLPVPVIGVGNITVGGTGKSPLVKLLVELCRERDLRPAVISRGYRAIADGRNDEAADCPAPVYCHPRRIRAGREAIAAGATCLIGDDLFQHRQLHRDCDIVCIDATRPWGEPNGRRGRLLPLGLLREQPSSLRRADAIVITRSDQIDTRQLAQLILGLRSLNIPLFTARHAPVALRNGLGEERRPDALRDQEVLLASGIGNPTAFATTATSCGMHIAGHEIFPDHHHYDRHDRQRLEDARGDQPMVITSKDAVKLMPLLDETARANCWVLQIGILLSNEDLEHLRSLLAARLLRRG